MVKVGERGMTILSKISRDVRRRLSCKLGARRVQSPRQFTKRENNPHDMLTDSWPTVVVVFRTRLDLTAEWRQAASRKNRRGGGRADNWILTRTNNTVWWITQEHFGRPTYKLSTGSILRFTSGSNDRYPRERWTSNDAQTVTEGFCRQ